MASKEKYMKLLSKSSRGIIISLSFQFVLGMAINLYGASPDDPKYITESPLIKASFIAHGINGLILPIFALSIIIAAFKTGDVELKKISGVGFISILIAAGGGISAIILKDNLAEFASFIMSLGFILSFIFYGKLYFILRK